MKTVAILIFSSTYFTFSIIALAFTFDSMNSFRRLLTKFDNELVMNLALSVICKM